MGSLNLNIKRETSCETCQTSSLPTLTFVHEQSLVDSYLPMQVLSMKIRDFLLPGMTWHPGLPSNLALPGDRCHSWNGMERWLLNQWPVLASWLESSILLGATAWKWPKWMR